MMIMVRATERIPIIDSRHLIKLEIIGLKMIKKLFPRAEGDDSHAKITAKTKANSSKTCHCRSVGV